MITTKQLHEAINRVRPQNGFITASWIRSGWTAQPDYRAVRS